MVQTIHMVFALFSDTKMVDKNTIKQLHSFWMIVAMIVPLLLSACNALDTTASRAAGGLRAGYDNTRQRMSHYIYSEKHEEAPVYVAHASDFCYQVMMDIICYDRPQPDLHLNLIGVQGDNVASYAYDDYLPQKLRGGAYKNGTATTSVSPVFVASQPAAMNAYNAGGQSDIMVSDLKGSLSGGALQQTPFYHSPSPVVGDPYQKPIEPMTESEYYGSDRSKTVPLQLMKK